jgi:hypothetical protein
MGGEFDLAWSAFEMLAFIGVTIGLVCAVVFGFIKLGFQYAPWIVGAAMLVWLFGNGGL